MSKFQPASVEFSGPGFSFLIHETNNATIGQYGFLLGEIMDKKINSTTKNDETQVGITKIIKINSGVPWPCRNYFPRGRVDKEKLRNFLGESFSKVVAWYKYESSDSVQFTLKDKLFHKIFQEIFEIPRDLFSVCFLLKAPTGITDTFSTYNYIQAFFRYYDSHHDELHLSIPNLSDSNSSYMTPKPASEAFNKALSTSTSEVDIENTKEVVSMAQIENSLENSVKQLVLELAVVEQQLFELEEEVELLTEGNHAVESLQAIDNNEDVLMDTPFAGTSSSEAEKRSESTENEKGTNEGTSSEEQNRSEITQTEEDIIEGTSSEAQIQGESIETEKSTTGDNN